MLVYVYMYIIKAYWKRKFIDTQNRHCFKSQFQ